MTSGEHFVPRGKKKADVSRGQVFFGLFSLFCLLLILRNSDVAISSMHSGLRLCATTVIPSLFPFMVLSELIVSGRLGEGLLQKITLPLQKLFRLPSVGCSALLLGMLCGFPVGAKSAINAYENRQLTRKETEHVLLFSNNPSSAFLISTVGVSLFKNRSFGILLYGATLAASLITGLGFALWRKKKEDDPKHEIPLSPNPPLKGAKLFTQSVASATQSVLLVCAYVVFFSTLCGALSLILNRFNIPRSFQALLFGFLELTGGVSQAAALADPLLSPLLCAFAAGWSGLSVHCQVLSVCDGRGLSFRNYFVAKLLQGLLCAIFCGVFLISFGL